MKSDFNTSFIIFLLFLGCNTQSVEQKAPLTQDKPVATTQKTTVAELSRDAKMKLPTGEELRVRLAITQAEQTIGLSGTQSKDWADDQAMLFFYAEDGDRMFWMPDTYFDLEIYFLDKDMTVLSVERNVPCHPGRSVPPKIAQTKVHYSRHVLEIKSSSPLAKKIKPGDKLSWQSTPTPWEIESSIRLNQ